MPIDINSLREYKGGNPQLVRDSQKRRYASVELVDEVIAIDEEWRSLTAKVDQINKQLRLDSIQIRDFTKDGKTEDADKLKAEIKSKKEFVASTQNKLEELSAFRDKKLSLIGNIVPPDRGIPIDNNEDNNTIAFQWGEFKTNDDGKYKPHHELLWRIGGFDPIRGTKVAGHRGYFLTGPGVLLNEALKNYGIQLLSKHGYTPLIPPFFMNKEAMAKVAQLSEFDEALYHVQGEKDDEKYLIATSEQPICSFHSDEWIAEKSLPIKYAGISACFRKEAGAHGKDNAGIFRVHQFDKIEQFVITQPEDSWNEHERMIKISCDFFQSIGIPYRVVNICSGALNNAAAKKYDLEGWYPGYQKFRELVSCSNCLDYQSRSCETRCGQKKMGDREKKYVHMLNSTLVACTRAICGILENHQTETGINVPEVLVPFMGGISFIPFVRDLDGYIAEGDTFDDEKKKDKKEKVVKEKVTKAPIAASTTTTTTPSLPTPSTTTPAVSVTGYPPEVQAAADKVRDLKAAKASKEEIVAAVGILNELKEKHGLTEKKKEEKKEPKKEEKKEVKKEEKKEAKKEEKKEEKKEVKKDEVKVEAKKSEAPKAKSEDKKDDKKKAFVKVLPLYSAEGQAALEKRLGVTSYIGAFSPTAEDEAIFNALSKKTIDMSGLPNTSRWFKHVKAFTPEETAKWPVTPEQLATTNFNPRLSTLFSL